MSAAEISADLIALEEFKSSHPFLAGNVDKLLDDMFANRALSTGWKYASAFQGWSNWCCTQALASLLADPVGVATYLLHVISIAESPSPVLSALPGINWVLRKAGLL